MGEHWLNYVYQYAVGGVFFFIVIFLAAKNKVLDWSNREGKLTYAILVGGFFFFATVHALWTYLVLAK